PATEHEHADLPGADRADADSVRRLDGSARPLTQPPWFGGQPEPSMRVEDDQSLSAFQSVSIGASSSSSPTRNLTLPESGSTGSIGTTRTTGLPCFVTTSGSPEVATSSIRARQSALNLLAVMTLSEMTIVILPWSFYTRRPGVQKHHVQG